jgi:hypothetical protein
MFDEFCTWMAKRQLGEHGERLNWHELVEMLRKQKDGEVPLPELRMAAPPDRDPDSGADGEVFPAASPLSDSAAIVVEVRRRVQEQRGEAAATGGANGDGPRSHEVRMGPPDRPDGGGSASGAHKQPVSPQEWLRTWLQDQYELCEQDVLAAFGLSADTGKEPRQQTGPTGPPCVPACSTTRCTFTVVCVRGCAEVRSVITRGGWQGGLGWVPQYPRAQAGISCL